MNDLISRSALIKALKEDKKSLFSQVFCYVEPKMQFDVMNNLKRLINNQPTVEAVPTSTIQRAIDNIGCVARSTTNADFINGCTASLIELDRALKTNYGADMRGEKNDS